MVKQRTTFKKKMLKKRAKKMKVQKGGATLLAINTQLNNPEAIAVDSTGNIYVADSGNNRIRKIDTSGNISTVAGGGSGGSSLAATATQLNTPKDVAIDSAGNIYIADTDINCIRKVDTNGNISTIAGNGNAGYNNEGTAISRQLNKPEGVAVDSAGNVYIADTLNYRIRKVDTNGIISTIAGNGIVGATATFGDGGLATAGKLRHPTGVAIDAAGNIYIADNGLAYVLKITQSNGILSKFAGGGLSTSTGDGGLATSAYLQHPTKVTTDSAGNVYISDDMSARIRKVDTNGNISTIAGNGIVGATATFGDGGYATSTKLVRPFGVAIDNAANIYIAQQGPPLSCIRKVNATGIISTIAGTTVAGNGRGYNGDVALPAPNKPICTITSADSSATITISNPDPTLIYSYSYSPNLSFYSDIDDTSLPTTIVELVNGTPTTFMVKATNIQNAFTESDPISVIPTGPPPDVPIISVTPGDTLATITINNQDTTGNIQYSYNINGAAFTNVSTFPINVTGLVDGTPYTFIVKAVTSSYGVAESLPATTRPVGIPPDVPIISVTPGDTLATITISNKDTTGNIQYSYNKNGGLYSLTTFPINVTGLVNATSYTFKVKATNTHNGLFTESLPATTTPVGPPAPAPFDIKATPGDKSVTISFTPPSANGATISGYKLSINNGTYSTVTTTGTISLTGLTNGTSYIYKVKATSSNGTFSESAPVTVIPIGIPPNVTGSPIITLDASGNPVITFTPATSTAGTPIVGYSVFTSAATTTPLTTVPVSPTTSPITVTGLTANKYTFTVKAYNEIKSITSAGVSTLITTKYSATGAVSAEKNTKAPAAPTAVSGIVSGNTTAIISFTPTITAGPATTYKVSSGTISVTGTTSPITVTGLTANTSYTFTVTPYNDLFAGTDGIATKAMMSGLPSAPSGLTATIVNATTASITFTPPTTGGAIVTYKVLNGTSITPLTIFTGTALTTTPATVLANATSIALTLPSLLTSPITYYLNVLPYTGSTTALVAGIPAVVKLVFAKPGAPATISSIITSKTDDTHGTATITFTPPTTGGGVTYYKVLKGTNATPLTTFTGTALTTDPATIGPTVTSVVVSNLTIGTTYYLNLVPYATSSVIGTPAVTTLVFDKPGKPSPDNAKSWYDKGGNLHAYFNNATTGGVPSSYNIWLMEDGHMPGNTGQIYPGTTMGPTTTATASPKTLSGGFNTSWTMSFGLTAVNALGESTRSVLSSSMTSRTSAPGGGARTTRKKNKHKAKTKAKTKTKTKTKKQRQRQR